MHKARVYSGKAQMMLALFGGLQRLRPHTTAAGADWLFRSPPPAASGAAALQVGP